MANSNQILVFIVSFLIGGFFLLSTQEAEAGNSGPVCCDFEPQADRCQRDADRCRTAGGVVCETDADCDIGPPPGPCTCPPPPPPPPEIPTLNQWGMITMAGVLGLFAVIGLLVMRKSGVVKASS